MGSNVALKWAHSGLKVQLTADPQEGSHGSPFELKPIRGFHASDRTDNGAPLHPLYGCRSSNACSITQTQSSRIGQISAAH